MYEELSSLEFELYCARRGERRGKTERLNGLTVLQLDFVAKPEGSRGLAAELAEAIEQCRLAGEGLEGSLLLVSDREARLVTLLTLWESRRFLAGRDRRIAWMQKLLAPFADGAIRAQTSVPKLVPVASGAASVMREMHLSTSAAEVGAEAGVS